MNEAGPLDRQQGERPQRRQFIVRFGGLLLLPGCASLMPDTHADAACFDTRTGSPICGRGLLKRMVSAPIVLLGEVHDSAAHHSIRAGLLRDWVKAVPSRPAAIVFEQFDREHDVALRGVRRAQLASREGPCDRGQGDCAAQLEALLNAASFDRRSWNWPEHRPLFEAAQASGAAWIAGNFSRASARRLADEPDAPIEPVLQAMVESARWSAPAQEALDAALMRGHCNALSRGAIERMGRVQRLRDAALALPLLDANERRSLLIAGNGHVRRDHGVPRYLGAYEYEALVVGFEEAPLAAGAVSLLSDRVGVERARGLAAAYDLVCLTPAARTEDPCAGFTSIPAGPAPGGVSPAAPTQTPSR